PVEITQRGLRQVQVQPKIGLNFAELLRSFLRADPDVIMVGEMRDQETARIAIEASLTGHLVLSTLHTNNAPETVVRLIEMGIDQYSFADSLLMVLAQRLTRRLCPDCKEPYIITQKDYDEIVNVYDAKWFAVHEMKSRLAGITLMRKVGCKKCDGTGYKGRLALHELSRVTDAIKMAIRKKVPADEYRTLAIEEGMRTLQMDGIYKVMAGETDLYQVLRVCLSQTIAPR
ncbi:MAG: ATPase, T2SS/T4P/T4SS family, partial [Smithellaceae bacterium]|nr:ATPase, T2SS/T4P/T4SS family [Smithellaceae bacterium]